jgi:very-short-patch-repair endonuclease
MTPAEARLWIHLRRSQLGCKFRRQHSVGPFVLDFYSPGVRLAIELDGAAHDSERAWHYDARRSRYLRENRIRIVRFVNAEVLQNLEGVLMAIREALREAVEESELEPHHPAR